MSYGVRALYVYVYIVLWYLWPVPYTIPRFIIVLSMFEYLHTWICSPYPGLFTRVDVFASYVASSPVNLPVCLTVDLSQKPHSYYVSVLSYIWFHCTNCSLVLSATYVLSRARVPILFSLVQPCFMSAFATFSVRRVRVLLYGYALPFCSITCCCLLYNVCVDIDWLKLLYDLFLEIY